MAIMTQPIDVRTGCDDKEGRLILIDGELVAVIVKLSDAIHGEDRGRWNVEATFDHGGHAHRTFASEAEAEAWVEHRLVC